MSNGFTSSTALPIANIVLRGLILVNWLYGGVILAILISSTSENWILAAFKLTESPDAGRLLIGIRAIAVLGLASIPLNRMILKRLVAIVDTVRAGSPFLAANAARLRVIAWVLVAINVLSILIGLIATTASSPRYPLSVNAGFSISGWLAVLLTFVLAKVFTVGAMMHEDLEGVV